MKTMMIGVYGVLCCAALGAALWTSEWVLAAWICFAFVAFFAAQFYKKRWEISELAVEALLRSFVIRERAHIKVCEVYYNIAADAIGEEEVNKQRDERITALVEAQSGEA